jgi:alcohol dehydrogenase
MVRTGKINLGQNMGLEVATQIAPIRLHLPGVIEFGWGKLETIWGHLEGAKRVFVLCDSSLLASGKRLASKAKRRGIQLFLSTEVVPEPAFEALEKVLHQARLFGPDAVVGLGGGSAMDVAMSRSA